MLFVYNFLLPILVSLYIFFVLVSWMFKKNDVRKQSQSNSRARNVKCEAEYFRCNIEQHFFSCVYFLDVYFVLSAGKMNNFVGEETAQKNAVHRESQCMLFWNYMEIRLGNNWERHFTTKPQFSSHPQPFQCNSRQKKFRKSKLVSQFAQVKRRK